MKRWNLLSAFLNMRPGKTGIDNQSIVCLIKRFKWMGRAKVNWGTKWKRIGIISRAREIPQIGVTISPLFSNCLFSTLVETRLL